MKITSVLVCITCLFTINTSTYAQNRMDEMWGEQKSKNPSQETTRGNLFTQGNYAMFVHWGLYSHVGNYWEGKTYYGISEWLMHPSMANIDIKEYKDIASSFNPINFDATKIVQLAKVAGMKYIIITSKHHDGFAMYHSAYDKFNIVDATPFKRDPMKELADACKKEGLGFGFYYSHNQDWTTPGGNGGPNVDSHGIPRKFDDYFKNKCLPQVEEITQNYGDMVLIWFDTPGNMPKEYAERLVEVVHRNQPKAFVSGRVGYNLGDYQTLGDMEVPTKNIEGLWESVDVTNDSWGHAWYDNNWKSPTQILQNLISTIARGGTYMLNIGLDGLGNIPTEVTKTLVASGKWIEQYPQVIYGAEKSPWGHKLPWGDAVCQGNKLYLTIYQWPESGHLYIPGLQSSIKSAYILSGQKKKKKIKYRKDGEWTILDVPFRKTGYLIPVIELNFDSPVIIVNQQQAVDPEFGLQNLSVEFAEANLCQIYKSGWMEKFGEWKHKYCVSDLHKGGSLTWNINVKQPGTYRIDIQSRGNGRNVWKVEVDGKRFIQNQQGSSSIFTEAPIGWIELDSAGKHTVCIRLIEGEQTDIAAISITPIAF